MRVRMLNSFIESLLGRINKMSHILNTIFTYICFLMDIKLTIRFNRNDWQWPQHTTPNSRVPWASSVIRRGDLLRMWNNRDVGRCFVGRIHIDTFFINGLMARGMPHRCMALFDPTRGCRIVDCGPTSSVVVVVEEMHDSRLPYVEVIGLNRRGKNILVLKDSSQMKLLLACPNTYIENVPV